MTRAAALVLLPALFLGCSGPSPEERVRAAIERMERHVEAGELPPLLEFVDDRYVDDGGRDKTAIGGLIAAAFYGREDVYLFTRIGRVEMDGERVRSKVYAAVVATPVEEASELGLDAELLAIEAAWVRRDGGWRVTSASWRRATPADLF